MTYHLGTQTLVRVGVLLREVSPWEGNFFQVIIPLTTSWKIIKQFVVKLLKVQVTKSSTSQTELY